jgi:hypothetical protein
MTKLGIVWILWKQQQVSFSAPQLRYSLNDDNLDLCVSAHAQPTIEEK